MNRQTHWLCALVFAVLVTGCAPAVKVIKPVNFSGANIKSPVSSLAFVPIDPFTRECEQALDIGVPQASIQVRGYLADFQKVLEKSLTSSGFTFSTQQDAVYIKLQVAEAEPTFRVIMAMNTDEVLSKSYSGIAAVVFRIEYLDGKNQTLGVIQQKWKSSQSLGQPAKAVAEFTRKTFGTKKAAK